MIIYYQPSTIKNLSRHHQARLNKDGGNEAESRDENNELEKMINYLISQNQLIISR